MSLLIATRKAILIPQPKIRTSQGIIPVLGSELLTDPGLEVNYTAGKCDTLVSTGAPTWTQSADAHGGSKAQQFVATAGDDRGRYAIVAGTAGTWYTFTMWAKRTVGSAGGVKIAFYTPTLGVFYGPVISSADYAQLAMCFRLPAAEDMHPQAVWETVGAGDTVIVDDGSLKANTLSSLFGPMLTGVPTGTYRCNPKLAPNAIPTQCGMVLNWDGLSDGNQDLVLAYIDNTTAYLDKCVAGTYSAVKSGAITYVERALLEVRHPAGTDTYRLFYNNVQVSTDGTIDDASIRGNTGFAGFKLLANSDPGVLVCY